MTPARRPTLLAWLTTLTMAGFLCFPLVVAVGHWLRPENRFFQKRSRNDLVGVKVPVARPALMAGRLWSGQYTDELNRWFAAGFPWRSDLIRLGNQVDYTVFRRSTGDTVIVGKNRELFEQPYLREYCNLASAISLADLEAEAALIAKLQRALKDRGVPFLLLITPSKPAIHPEHIPDAFLARKLPTARAYDDFIPLLDRHGVNYLDTHRLLMDLKPTSSAAFYSRGGIHWNDLGMGRAAVALTDRLGEVIPIPLARLRQTGSVTIDNNPVDDNADLARVLNVLDPPRRFPVPHLPLRREGSAPPAPRLVVVAGSYAETLLSRFAEHGIFQTIDLYFYWHVHHARWAHAPDGRVTSSRSLANPDTLDWERDIFSASAVVLEINETILNQGSNSHFHAFAEAALKHLPPPATRP